MTAIHQSYVWEKYDIIILIMPKSASLTLTKKVDSSSRRKAKQLEDSQSFIYFIIKINTKFYIIIVYINRRGIRKLRGNS